ncbi:PiggyBac transposable element-derived protein [Trichinella pseudospiralis]
MRCIHRAVLAPYVRKRGHNDWKPRVILEYNACKGEVDAMDKMVQEYSCCRNTKRCPLLLLMNMMDVAAVNAFVLVRPNIECRASCMQKNIQRCILMVLVEDQMLKNTRNEETSSRKKFRCALCIARGDKKNTQPNVIIFKNLFVHNTVFLQKHDIVSTCQNELFLTARLF